MDHQVLERNKGRMYFYLWAGCWCEDLAAKEEGKKDLCPYWQTEANYIASGILKIKTVPSPRWCLTPAGLGRTGGVM